MARNVLIIVSLLLDTCGESVCKSGSTSIRTHPYHLSVLHQNTVICSATLITQKFSVTTATCTHGKSARKLFIVAGTGVMGIGGTKKQVDGVKPHPDFKYPLKKYDVSVVVTSALPTSVSIKPIKIISSEDKQIRPGQVGNFTAWDPTKKTIKYMEMHKISTADCYTFQKNNVTYDMACYGYDDEGGPCGIDVGGGLTIDGRLAGIALFPLLCGKEHNPSVFVNIQYRRIFVFLEIFIRK